MKFKITGVTVAATLALCAFGSALASANWFVNGAELTAPAELSSTARVVPHVTFLVPSVGDVTILCPGSAIFHATKPFILPGTTPPVLHAKGFLFLKCASAKPATGCALAGGSQTISTVPIVGIPTLFSGSEDSITFSAQTKSLLAEIEFSETNTCAFNGIEGLKGSFKFRLPTGQTEEVNQEMVGLGSVENNSLELANSKTFMGGGIVLSLANGSKWSFK